MSSENHLLRILEPAATKLLKPHMRTITVEHGDVLHSSSGKMEFVYFPKSTIISVVARTEQGLTAETSIVGREGMIGSSAIHGIMTSFAESLVQVSGEAVRIPAAEVHRAGKTSESFRKTIALFDLSLLAQAQQSTACQALHQVESRAARWLLQCRRRLGSDDIRLIQDFSGSSAPRSIWSSARSRMLGLSRSGEAGFPFWIWKVSMRWLAIVTTELSDDTRNCWDL
jgi:CRP-like cAMP-binding protein